MKMNLKEFIREHCKDISYSKQDTGFKEIDDSEFPCTGYETTEEGKIIKTVTANGNTIPIMDILTLREDDYKKMYPSDEEAELRINYLDNFIILQGEEVLEMHLIAVQEAMKRAKKTEVSYSMDDFTCS